MARNVLSSLVVFFVALPLSIGIALAAGAPIESGLLAAAVGGLVTGALSGAPITVSGPAAGLTVLVYQMIQTYGFDGLAVIVLIGGAIQLVAAGLRLGWVFERVPHGVLKGMLSAIGGIILINQLHVLFGTTGPNGLINSIMAVPASVIFGFKAVGVVPAGMTAVATLLFWPKLGGVFKKIPAPLPAIVFATLVAIPFEVPRVAVEPILGGIGAHFSGLMGLFGNSFSIAEYIAPAVGLAFVASSESLLTARAIDLLIDEHNRNNKDDIIRTKTQLNKELAAQGTGNIVTSLIGGLPITAVIVRSTANLESGGRTRASTVLHGAWLVVFVLAFPFLLEWIPLSALAGILVVTGWKLLELKEYAHIARTNKEEAIIWGGTFVGILVTSLLTGLMIGLGIAIIYSQGKKLIAYREKQKRGHSSLGNQGNVPNANTESNPVPGEAT